MVDMAIAKTDSLQMAFRLRVYQYYLTISLEPSSFNVEVLKSGVNTIPLPSYLPMLKEPLNMLMAIHLLISAHAAFVRSCTPCHPAISSAKTLFTSLCCLMTLRPLNWGLSMLSAYIDPQPPLISWTCGRAETHSLARTFYNRCTLRSPAVTASWNTATV